MADLRRQSADFAETLQRLLNGTICDGITIAAFVHSPTRVLVGHGLSKATLETKPFRLRLGQGRPYGWLDLSYRLCLDDSGKYLTVVSSYVGIYGNEDPPSLLCHIDYEREKPHGYPEAHLQVEGDSQALAGWRCADGEHGRVLHDLHFPVGGRRYRPALEDVIEFLVVERLAEPRRGWQKLLDDSRDEFRRKQLRAAILRDMETALQAVRDFTGSG